MAKFVVKSGLLANLPAYSSAIEGTLLFTTDSHELFANLGGEQFKVGAFDSVANLAALSGAGIDTTKMYYVRDIKALAVYNSDKSQWEQINADTGALSATITGSGSAGAIVNGDVINGVTYNASTRAFTFTTARVTAAGVDRGASNVDADLTAVEGRLTTLEGADTVAGSVAKSIKDAIGALDTTNDVGVASQSGKVITITGSVKEEDGIIAKGTGTDIILADVASTGAAEDVSTIAITDGAAETPETLYAAGNVQGVLTSIARDLNDLGTTSAVTVEKLATATSGYLSSYVVKQNGAQVGATIDIPKDYLVKSANVAVVVTADTPYEGAVVGDKYIDFVINVKTGTADTDAHIYIPVNDLVHPLSGGTTTVANEYELQVSVSNTNQITTTLNNIYAQKVLYTPAATTKLTGVTNVKGAIDAIDTLIQGMDADLDAVTNTSETDIEKVAVVTGVTEVDGVLTAVDSIDVDKAGAATRAKNAVIGASTDATSANTIHGVKNYIGTIPNGATSTNVVDYVDEKLEEGLTWGSF